jgi:hypothetical protein
MSLETQEKWGQFQEAFRKLANAADEYAGLPMPVDGEELIVHPSYRFASVVNKKPVEGSDEDFVNTWQSRRAGGQVYVYRVNGKSRVAFLPGKGFEIERILRTYGLQCVWDLQAERRALDKLGDLVENHKFRGYMLTGTFIESSKRSGVTYIFRRLRPTIALSSNGGEVKFLAALCLHPIGYYNESYAGAMVPTDEVIAHLVMMRGDEVAFWKYSNQHQQI